MPDSPEIYELTECRRLLLALTQEKERQYRRAEGLESQLARYHDTLGAVLYDIREHGEILPTTSYRYADILFPPEQDPSPANKE